MQDDTLNFLLYAKFEKESKPQSLLFVEIMQRELLRQSRLPSTQNKLKKKKKKDKNQHNSQYLTILNNINFC